MSSAMNHRKRSHRSHNGHYAAARTRMYTCEKKQTQKLGLRRFFNRRNSKKQEAENA